MLVKARPGPITGVTLVECIITDKQENRLVSRDNRRLCEGNILKNTLDGVGVVDVLIVEHGITGIPVHGFATVLTTSSDDIDVIYVAVVHHFFFRGEVEQGANIVAIVNKGERVELMVIGEVDDVGGDDNTGHDGFLSVVGVGLPDDMDSITHRDEGCKGWSVEGR